MDGDIGKSGLGKRSGYFFLCRVRMIAVIAEVPEHHIAQTAMRYAKHQFRSLFIRQVAMASTDPLFDGPGALGIGIQQWSIVVSLDEERMGTA